MVGPGLSMKWFPTIAPSRPMISAPNHRDWMVLLLSGKPGPVRASFAHCNGESAPHVTPGNGCANVTSKAALPCSPAAVTTTTLAEGRLDSALGFQTRTTSPFRGTEFPLSQAISQKSPCSICGGECGCMYNHRPIKPRIVVGITYTPVREGFKRVSCAFLRKAVATKGLDHIRIVRPQSHAI